MRIAVVGTGIAGLTVARLLNRRHEVTVFEARERLGGHTATMDVVEDDRQLAIDTGFIVYNDWTYPNFIRLLEQLGVASQPTSMGFSVSCAATGVEYAGNNLNTLFAQRRNLVSAEHWGMLRDIVRFNRQAVRDWRAGNLAGGMTLGDYLAGGGYGEAFIHRYLVPMGSAIWSASRRNTLAFPAEFFVRFFFNHGLLNLINRPQWRVVGGGSRAYIEPLVADFRERIRVSSPVQRIERGLEGVTVHSRHGAEAFDGVVIASHSDEALAMLGDPTPEEKAVLGAMPYRDNDVVLHTDTRLLPANRLTWSSWNYLLRNDPDSLPVLTYNMNILQRLDARQTYCVTLNAGDAIAEEHVIGRYQYAHPQFSPAFIAAQNRWEDINGVNRTWYCGAYWANGFHEDGVTSALRVAEAFGEGLDA